MTLLWGCSESSTNSIDEPKFNLEHVSDTIYSNIVFETYSLLYHLPATYHHYRESGYPVIYLLDGKDLLFDDFELADGGVAGIVDSLTEVGEIPECIIVAIGYKYEDKRSRDFLYPYDDINSDSGGGDKYYLFLRDELIPFIDECFNTSGVENRTLAGYSASGNEVMYSMFQYNEAEGAIFENYLAGSPRLYYHDFYILDAAKSCFERSPNNYPFKFYMAQGDGKFELTYETYMTFLLPFQDEYLHEGDMFKWEIIPEVNHYFAHTPVITNGLIYLFSN